LYVIRIGVIDPVEFFLERTGIEVVDTDILGIIPENNTSI